MLTAMDTEPRLRIMRLLFSSYPDGLVVGDVQSELDIPGSSLSHHLEKLKHEELVTIRREATCIYYWANRELGVLHPEHSNQTEGDSAAL
jgi:DNA-binding transcriptional ArsR family regulator